MSRRLNILFLLSIVITTIAFNALIYYGFNFSGYKIDLLQIYENSEGFRNSMCLYVAICRLRQFVTMWILYRLLKSTYVDSILIVMLGVLSALMECVEVFYEGTFGLLIWMAIFIPQFIFYILSAKKLSESKKSESRNEEVIKTTVAVVLFFIGVGLEIVNNIKIMSILYEVGIDFAEK